MSQPPTSGFPPPGGFPPGAFPPGSYPPPPGAFPPGAFPPGAFPPGAFPPGAFPPGAFPPGAFPPGFFPPGSYPPPPGSFPPGAFPPSSYPQGAQPPGSFPLGAYPPAPGSFPPGSFPPNSYPQGAPQPGAFPPGAFPPGAFPPGSLPPGASQPGAYPGSYPPGMFPPGLTPPQLPKRMQVAYFNAKKGEWWISGDNRSFGEVPQRQFTISIGSEGDIPVPGNYFGDGVRVAVYKPSKGIWYIKGPGMSHWSNTAGNVEIKFGKKDDIPVPSDYLGKGTTQLAVFRPSEGNWYIKGEGAADWDNSTGNLIIQCGAASDVPVPADWFGTGKTTLAVFRPKDRAFYVKGPDLFNWNTSSGNQTFKFVISDKLHKDKDVSQTAHAIPVPADYAGEGKVRAAFFFPKTGHWLIKGAGFGNWDDSSGNIALQCGCEGDIPIPGDYFGEGKASCAVFRSKTLDWYIKGAGFADWNGTPNNLSLKWGKDQYHDKPVPYKYGF